ncbi:hypothetical protein BER93_08020 [Xanthomonas fragariae]|nr:hypothetical protein BER93_08020 [Xanthomonas fragariae]
MTNVISGRGKAQFPTFGNKALALPSQVAAIWKFVTWRGLRVQMGLLFVAKFDDDVRLAICIDRGKLPERHRHLRMIQGCSADR